MTGKKNEWRKRTKERNSKRITHPQETEHQQREKKKRKRAMSIQPPAQDAHSGRCVPGHEEKEKRKTSKRRNSYECTRGCTGSSCM